MFGTRQKASLVKYVSKFTRIENLTRSFSLPAYIPEGVERNHDILFTVLPIRLLYKIYSYIIQPTY